MRTNNIMFSSRNNDKKSVGISHLSGTMIKVVTTLRKIAADYGCPGIMAIGSLSGVTGHNCTI